MSNDLDRAESTFWTTLRKVSEEVEQWPEWMKAYRIDIYGVTDPIEDHAPHPSSDK